MDENLQFNDVKKVFCLNFGSNNDLFCKLMSFYCCSFLEILVFIPPWHFRCGTSTTNAYMRLVGPACYQVNGSAE